jgi:hypothetical protein
MTPRRLRCESADHRDADESSEPTEHQLPIDATEIADPMDPIESTEPTLPIDSTEPFDAMERTESCDQSDHLDATASHHAARFPAAGPDACGMARSPLFS